MSFNSIQGEGLNTYLDGTFNSHVDLSDLGNHLFLTNVLDRHITSSSMPPTWHGDS